MRVVYGTVIALAFVAGYLLGEMAHGARHKGELEKEREGHRMHLDYLSHYESGRPAGMPPPRRMPRADEDRGNGPPRTPKGDGPSTPGRTRSGG